jgi:MSHA biogenesis protein MshM
MVAYGEGKQQVGRKHVAGAASDTIGIGGKRRVWPWAAAGSLLAVAGGLAWALSR